MGAIVNSVMVIIGSLLGQLIGRYIPKDLNKMMMQGIGLVILIMGISGALQGESTILMILSIVFGVVIGGLLDLDGRVNRFVNNISRKFQGKGDNQQLSHAFISATMIFCVGSMAIIGSLESGLMGDNTTLYTKSVIDTLTVILLSSSLGIGVIFSSIPILVYQGGLTLFARLIAPLLQDAVIVEISAVGSVLLVALALNMLEIIDIKLINFIPGMFLPVLFMLFL
jgi:hypothetical protein